MKNIELVFLEIKVNQFIHSDIYKNELSVLESYFTVKGVLHSIKLNFEGGQLSSDSGMLLLHEFCDRLGVQELLEKHLPSSDSEGRVHHKPDVIYQKLMRIIAGYNSNNQGFFSIFRLL